MESEIKSKKRGQVSESKVSHILITKIIYESQNAPFLILLAPYLRLGAIFARFVDSSLGSICNTYKNQKLKNAIFINI